MVSGDRLPKHIRERKEPLVIAEYQMPYIGTIRVMDNTSTPETEKHHGNYWVHAGEKIGIVGRFSQTQEEALRKASEEIAVHLLKRRKELSDEATQIDSLIPTTSLGIITSGDWLNRYKTEK
jgi:hypothetical protein